MASRRASQSFIPLTLIGIFFLLAFPSVSFADEPGSPVIRRVKKVRRNSDGATTRRTTTTTTRRTIRTSAPRYQRTYRNDIVYVSPPYYGSRYSSSPYYRSSSYYGPRYSTPRYVSSPRYVSPNFYVETSPRVYRYVRRPRYVWRPYEDDVVVERPVVVYNDTKYYVDETEETDIPELDCPNDTKAHASRLRSWCATTRGTKHGPYVSYYDNGQIREEGYYEYGKKSDVWISYFRDGGVQSEGGYVDGRKSGAWTVYDVQGKKPTTIIYE